MTELFPMEEVESAEEAKGLFQREVGTSLSTETTMAGNRTFLKFLVGRTSPIYNYALRETQKHLSPNNVFKGALGLTIARKAAFRIPSRQQCFKLY